MTSFENFISQLITAFLIGLIAGLLISVLYSTLEVVLLSMAAGAIAGVILFFYNLIYIIDDLNGIEKAISGSIISIIMWASGLIGSIVGSSMVN